MTEIESNIKNESIIRIMAELAKIVSFLDEYLKINEFDDDSWNGLQFEGTPDVKKVLFAVDAGIDTFKKAAEGNFDMVIVHHGHFWSKANPSLVEWSRERFDILFRNGISLYAVHLPLDAHKDVGNNAQLLKILGAKIRAPFAEYHGQSIGWIGEFKPPMSIKDIEIKLSAEIGAKCKILNFGKEMISSIAVCSGGGGFPAFFEAVNSKVELYLTGDATEIYHTAKDAGLNVIFAGHHNTETVGVKALCAVLKKRYKLDAVFLDIPTGL